jgi:hypothetical protein
VLGYILGDIFTNSSGHSACLCLSLFAATFPSFISSMLQSQEYIVLLSPSENADLQNIDPKMPTPKNVNLQKIDR